MCSVIGVENVDQLFEDIPEQYRVKDVKDLKLPFGLSEMEVGDSLTPLWDEELTGSSLSEPCTAYQERIFLPVT